MEDQTLEQILEGAIIVMIDDNATLNQSYSFYFKKKGKCQFETFLYPVEALKYIKENDVDLLILDMRIPSMHGLLILDEIRKYNKFIPVIINSAYTQEEDAKEQTVKERYPIVGYFDKYQTMKDMELAVKNGILMSKLNKKAVQEAREKELESLSKAEMVQQVARGFAHEINNATAPIKSGLGLLNEVVPYFVKLEISVMKKNLGDSSLFDDYTKVIDKILTNSSCAITFDEKYELRKKYDADLIQQACIYGATSEIETLKKIFNSPEKKIIIKSLDNIHQLVYPLNIMEPCVERIVNTVKAAKDITAMDLGEKSEFDVNQCLDGIIKVLYIQERKNTQIVKNYSKLPSVWGNQRQILEALLNIIKNAFEATENKGEIKIETSVKDSYVRIAVTDNGPGIMQDKLDKIFNPFYTTKIGTNFGIGLYISKKYIELNKGSVSVCSKPGETVFEILLPEKKP